jgi:uncharacterized protein
MGLACTISAKLKPRSHRNAIAVLDEGRISIAVTSPPVDGKANEHAIALLAEVLGVRTSAVMIIKGHTSHNKVFGVQGIDAHTATKKLREKTICKR